MVPSKYVDCLLLMTTALTSSNNTSGEYYRGNGYDGNNVRVNVTIVIDELKITNPRDMVRHSQESARFHSNVSSFIVFVLF